jgi:hypothetical protein
MNVLNNITVSDQITEVLSLGSINGPVQATSSPQYQFTNGTSTSGTVPYVIDLHWELSGVNSVTLASGASVTYTLSALTDTEGRTIAFARVHKLLIWLVTRTDGDYLIVGNAATHPWTGLCSSGTATLSVYDALAAVAANAVGLVVTSGSSDQVKIHNSGSASITFGINAAGCST